MLELLFSRIAHQQTLFQVIANGEPAGVLRGHATEAAHELTPRRWSWHPYHRDEEHEFDGNMTVQEAKAFLKKELNRMSGDLGPSLNQYRVYAQTRFGFRYDLCVQANQDSSVPMPMFCVGNSTCLDRLDVMDEAMMAIRQPLPDSHVPGDWVVAIQAECVQTGHTHELMTSRKERVRHWTSLRDSAAPNHNLIPRVA